MERSILHEFLKNVNFEDPNCRDTIENFVMEKIGIKSRKNTFFSIGEDENEEPDDVQTRDIGTQSDFEEKIDISPGERSYDDVKREWEQGKKVTPGEALRLLKQGEVKQRELENRFDFGFEKAIAVRRAFLRRNLEDLPFRGYDYKYVVNSCCENVIGYIPVPVGIAGPLCLNDEKDIYVPMATTEGALIASTNRGMNAIKASNGVQSTVYNCGMTRAPVVKFPTARDAINLKMWLEIAENLQHVRTEFESCSRFARLKNLEVIIDGNLVFLRFVAFTGDAMGMNMVSKSCSQAIRYISEQFPEMQVVSLSGNYCVDKKAAAVNWTQGRGRSVVAECVLPANVVSKILKTTPIDMANAANAKLQIGSSRAGCIGGSNAHAANIVAAVFIATGQDPAQVVSSSMCSTRMEVTPEGSLYVSCTMTCMEVGTVGGGTILPPQKACLQSLNCAGPNYEKPGRNSEKLCEIIAATVLAGELSLMAALVTNDLVASHMKLNRSKLQLYAQSPPTKSKIEEQIENATKNMQKSVKLSAKRVVPQEMVQCSNIL
ncbi:unnamed protein product [Caenorhabditis angaria]|uniref:3-hydroxy-3-methylglutaryl-coenzyme A reductase n=1 Tax=Caenorhabditis angaria TaxID=860376 RepID=A0A9P1IG71_9PELO|nr:unnamed protein product [Caenorhabditis angaria]